MAWILLLSAGVLEVVWTYFLKKSAGFTQPVPTVVTIVVMIASVALLSAAMRTLPLGTAYVIWTGIGAVGAFLVGVFVLGESASVLRMIAAGLIVAGIVMMKIAGDP